MNSTNWVILGTAGYILVFCATTIGLVFWRSKRRKEKTPESFTLLRGPGETLRRRVQEAEVSLELWVIATAFGPLLLAGVFIYTLPALPEDLLFLQLIAIGLILTGGIVIGGTRLFRRLSRMRNDRLGYLGERAVGEYLEPLKLDDYRVFHDVPAANGKKLFNLDHVTVGPTGVTLIETKTRRKRPARPGYKDHEITFDGRQVIFPWGEDTHGIKQAISQADWLHNWIESRTGLKTPVRPILAFPGWFIKEAPSEELRVINPKILPQAIKGRGSKILEDHEIDLISRQLESICRDVED